MKPGIDPGDELPSAAGVTGVTGAGPSGGRVGVGTGAGGTGTAGGVSFCGIGSSGMPGVVGRMYGVPGC